MQSEKPEQVDLTKYAMGKYKEIFSNDTNGSASAKVDGASAKRKIDVENGSNSLSGVAKLAKFNFSK